MNTALMLIKGKHLQHISNRFYTTMKAFKYTIGNSLLTNEQRSFYEENGYLVFRNLVSNDVLEECRQQFIGICNETITSPIGILMKDKSLRKTGAKGEFLVNKIQDFLYDDVFFKYVVDQKVVDIVTDIIGPNITAMHSMLINKPPDANKELSRHPVHQDLHYFPFRPADKIVASWTAMEPVHEKNGCLFVIPGTHKGDLYSHRYPDDGSGAFYHGVQGFDLVPKLNLPMEKGDTVFFHPILLHGSGPNLTKGFRKAISCHYADTNCNFINVMGTSQENIAKEIEEILSKRGATMNYIDLWKTKSRLVKGNPGNFQSLDSKL